MSEIRCQICGSSAEPVWESTGSVNGGYWFAGLYSCQFCGHFKASGTIRNGHRKVIHWHPACQMHGTDPVHVATCERHDYMTHDAEWVCAVCSRRMAVQGSRLVTTWEPYQPVWLEPSVVDEAMRRLGGLPHD